MIPTESIDAIGVRPVMGAAEAEAVLEAIPSIQVDMTSNWNQRYRENVLRL